MNSDAKELVAKKPTSEQRKAIQKKVIYLEKYNYNQKEFTNQEMINKIKKIIEAEVSK